MCETNCTVLLEAKMCNTTVRYVVEIPMKASSTQTNKFQMNRILYVSGKGSVAKHSMQVNGHFGIPFRMNGN